jgi:hypothetical protein
MRLKHANVTTSDVSGLAQFFEQFFEFKNLEQRGQGFALLCDKDGFVLTLMKPKKSDPDRYPEMFHLGFYYDSADLVSVKHAELSMAGLSPGDIETVNRGGLVTTFYCRPSPGSVLIEVATPPGFMAITLAENT